MPSHARGRERALAGVPTRAEDKDKPGNPFFDMPKARNLELSHFTINGSSTEEQLQLFIDIYREDFKERAKGGKPLSPEDERLAERLAREIIEKEGKQAFVVTRRTSRIAETENGTKAADVHVPIGFTIFWTELHGHMHASDMVYHTDRIFISEKLRRMGFGTEMILRNWEKVLEDCPSLAYASFHDPFHFCTGYVLQSMKDKGLVSEVARRVNNNDYFVKIHPEALPSQTLSGAGQGEKPGKGKARQ